MVELTASLAERMAANAERKERAAAVQQRLADLQVDPPVVRNHSIFSTLAPPYLFGPIAD